MNQPEEVTRKYTARNLIIFTAAALGSGWLGVLINRAIETPDPQQGLGTLVWILLPAATGLLLRAFGGDGWQDAGLMLRLKTGWKFYFLSFLLFPLLSVLVLGLGLLLGTFASNELSVQRAGAIASSVFVSFASLFLKNVLEEFAWRGYLTPRFESLKLHPLFNHALTGSIWALWHVPYWVYFVDVKKFSSLSPTAFIALGIFSLIVTAVTYGELRLLSNSAWPAVILHSMANAITAAIVFDGFFKLDGIPGVFLSPGNDGLIHSILFMLAGLLLLRHRRKQSVAV